MLSKYSTFCKRFVMLVALIQLLANSAVVNALPSQGSGIEPEDCEPQTGESETANPESKTLTRLSHPPSFGNSEPSGTVIEDQRPSSSTGVPIQGDQVVPIATGTSHQANQEPNTGGDSTHAQLKRTTSTDETKEPESIEDLSITEPAKTGSHQPAWLGIFGQTSVPPSSAGAPSSGSQQPVLHGADGQENNGPASQGTNTRPVSNAACACSCAIAVERAFSYAGPATTTVVTVDRIAPNPQDLQACPGTGACQTH